MRLDSFDQIYQSYFESVYRYALSLSGNTQTAEEITQETFFKAMRSLDQFQGKSSLKSWLCTIAKNLWLSDQRKKKTQPIDDGGFSEVETAMILSMLPPDLSQIFIKRYYEGYTSRRLADEYGLSPSGVRAALSRARNILREKLKE